MIVCVMLRNIPDFPGCCDSCHDEQDSEYNNGPIGMSGDGENFNVCCKVSTWLATKSVSVLDPAPEWLIKQLDLEI